MENTLTRRTFIRKIEIAGVTVVLAGCSDLEGELDTDPTNETTQQSEATQTMQQSESNAGTGGRSKPDQHGPQRTGKFVVEFDDDKVPGWKTVTIPAVSIEQGDYRDGNQAPQEREVAEPPYYDALRMDRHMIDARLREWMHTAIDSSTEEATKDISIRLELKNDERVIRWEFLSCWPKNYIPPDVPANEGDELSPESLVLGFDQVKRTVE